MGRILKGAELRDGKWVVPTPRSVEVVPADLAAPEVAAEPEVDLAALLAEAQAEAERILAAASQEAERLREAARQEGYQQGFSQGENDGRQQWQVRVQELASEAQALLDQRKRWFQDAEKDVAKLALLVADRILHRDARNRDMVVALIQSTLVHLEDAAVVRIRVHPSDAPGLAGSLNLPEVEIKPDATVGLGGAVLETLTGRVDGRFVTQFRELASAVLMTDPDADPVLAPVLTELEAPLEARIPAAEPAWKSV